jgi:beta-N-acetylhexosaminidase
MKGQGRQFGLHYIVGLGGPELSDQERRLLEELKPAGIFLGKQNFLRSAEYAEWTLALARLLSECRACVGRERLLVCIDHEGGRVHMPPAPIAALPYAESYAAHAREAGAIHGAELRSLGVNLAFGPVCDINSNPANPVIGPRAFGADAAQVTEAALAYCDELHKFGVMACPKHFPGHGDTQTDPHVDYPSVPLAREELMQRELAPFKAVIAAGAPCLMTAHVLFPAIDSKYPATLSRRMLTDLLRGEMGFKGSVVSDDLEMHAIKKNFSDEEAAAALVNAGCDLLLLCENVERARVFAGCAEAGLARGTIDRRAFDQSHQRVLALLEGAASFAPHQLSKQQLGMHAERAKTFGIHKRQKPMKIQEAVPVKVEPPVSEPQLRVGIVLEEDAKSVVAFTSPSRAVLVCRDGREFELEPGRRYVAEMRDGIVRLLDQAQEVAQLGYVFMVSEKQPGEPAPGSGILVEGIVAGRGFHWKKEIAQTLPGTLEFIPMQDRIVVVNTIGLEFYVAGVLTSEMSGRSCPREFGKAQATAARSWAQVFLRNKYPGRPYMLCNDDFSQRYQGTTHLSDYALEVAKECRGDFLVTADGCVCPAYYSKGCGGHGEEIENLFGFPAAGNRAGFDSAAEHGCALDLTREDDFLKWLELGRARAADFFCGMIADDELPRYLGAVDEKGSYFRWTHTTDAAVIARKLRDRCGLEGVRAVRALRPGRRGVSGRFLDLRVAYTDAAGKEREIHLEDQFYIRACLHDSFLYSSAFVFSEERDNEGNLQRVHFEGAGWGHAGGFCQIGALGMGLKGYRYQDILRHYYPEASLRRAY